MRRDVASALLAVLLLAVAFAIAGCGRPSTKEIEQAVRESLSASVPSSLAESLVPGRDARIDSLSVVQVGRAQGEGDARYWPVRMRVKGVCTLVLTNDRPFGGVAEFYLSQDPYGKWVAELGK